MPIKDQEAWRRIAAKNAYGRTCMTVAQRVMEILNGVEAFDSDDIISQAHRETETGRRTPFIEFAVVQAVYQCHSRGEEFHYAWSKGIEPGYEDE